MTSTPISPAVDIRRATDRFTNQYGWLDSKHSFSFGHHRDRNNTNHGQLLVLNDDRRGSGRMERGVGFEVCRAHSAKP